MDTNRKPSEMDDQLSPESAERKERIEQLGYQVRYFPHFGWKVVCPEGVRFLRLRCPDKPAYSALDPDSYNDNEHWNQYWDNLPAERRYSEERQGFLTKYYRVDPDALDQWNRFSDASEKIFDLLFDTPESRKEYEREEDDKEEHDYDSYLGEIIFFEVGVANIRPSDGRSEYYGPVIAVRWNGTFRQLSLEGIEIESTNLLDFEEFESRSRTIDRLHEYDAKKLSLRLMAQNHPDIIFSLIDELSGDTEVNWVLPGLIEHQGLTLTYAAAKRGKTTLVMSELWRACQEGQCNVIYLAFEGHNGLGAHVVALKEHFGSCPTFAVTKAHWNLSQPAEWEAARKFVADMKQSLTAIQDAPTVVVFDTVGSALKTGSRITGAPETFLGEAKRLQQENGVALWLVSHQNDKGELYGFKGFIFDADVITRITRKTNGRDHVHTRTLGRHVESKKHLSNFRIEKVGPGIVAVEQTAAAIIDERDVTVCWLSPNRGTL